MYRVLLPQAREELVEEFYKLTQVLGMQFGRESRRADEVGEHDGDLAVLTAFGGRQRRVCGQARAATRAKSGTLGHR